MFTLAFWVIFGVGHPCQSSAIEQGDLRLVRPEWAFINTTHETSCEASKDAEVTLAVMGIDPWGEVEHEQAPSGIFED